MLAFKPIELQNAEMLRGFFSQTKSRSSDETAGNALIWRDFFAYEYCIYNETLVIKSTFADGNTYFDLPVGKDVNGCINALIGEFKSVSLITDSGGLSHLCANFSTTATPIPDWWEYLYNAEDLKTFSGRKYNGQRNHANYFEKNNPSWQYFPVTGENAARVIAFANALFESKPKTPMLEEEHRKIPEILLNLDIYGQSAGALADKNGNILAFAIGEVKGDTLFVRIEKALQEIRGAHQMIVREFTSHNAVNGVLYVNREEDMGNEGLRRAKLAYHPCDMVKKYTVRIDGDTI